MPVLAAALAAGALLFGGPTLVSAREGTFVGEDTISSKRSFKDYWVSVHTPTTLWTHWSTQRAAIRTAPQWTVFKVVADQRGEWLKVALQDSDERGWIYAGHVGPTDPRLAAMTHQGPPANARVIWKGDARISMYTCVELGGCKRTASGMIVQPGIVAVDPRLIPLGSKVWIQGLGTFVAADTGSAIKGARVDVFSTSYRDALQWGMQQGAVVAYRDD